MTINSGRSEYNIEADRYHALLEGFSPNQNTNEVTIELKRIVFGFHLYIDMAEISGVEQIRFAINTREREDQIYFLDVTDQKASLEIPFMTPGDSDYDYIVSNEDYEETIELRIGTEDNFTKFHDGSIQVKRNTMYSIDFRPTAGADDTRTPLSIRFEDAPMEEASITL